jgi:hypothetical protein
MQLAPQRNLGPDVRETDGRSLKCSMAPPQQYLRREVLPPIAVRAVLLDNPGNRGGVPRVDRTTLQNGRTLSNGTKRG